MNTKTEITISPVIVAIANSQRSFPVRRIFCIARNYAAHTVEMGGDPKQGPPFYFTKSADALVAAGGDVAYPPRTSDLHHEIELVAAIGKGGANIAVADALQHVFGYAVGIDLTRRDLQEEAKNARQPWDAAKNFDHGAPIGEIHTVDEIGHPSAGRIWLSVNGKLRQDGDLADMVWSVPECIAELSTYCKLAPGDLLYSGTPAGVGALQRGDNVRGGIEAVGEISIKVI